MSLGFGKKSSDNQSQQSSQSYVWGQQTPFLTDLWGSAFGAADPGGAGTAMGGVNDFMSPLMQDTATSIAALTNPADQIAAQRASLQSGLGQLFREEINPAIETQAISAGGFGGGRQGVAQGVATGQLADAYTQGLGDIVARANQTALGAGAMMPSLGTAQQQLAMGQFSAPMDILGALAQIIGGPTVLQKSTGTSSGSSSGWNFGLGLPDSQ